MSESPIFAKVKAEGKTSVNPLKESFRSQTKFQICFISFIWRCNGSRCYLVHRAVLRNELYRKSIKCR
jgi:hypothetical protein